MNAEEVGMVAAVDLGGTNIRVAVVDSIGTTMGFVVSPTGAACGPDVVIDRILSMIRDSLARAQIDAARLVGVGIGAPGPLNWTTGVIHEAPTNLPGWNNVRLADRISVALGVPVFLEKDANAAALAEFAYGDNRGVADMLYITVSTGVGGGLILDGQVWHGTYGSAGEFGHMTVDFEGLLCDCGNRGCIQKIASGPNLADWAVSQVVSGKTSLLGDIGVHTQVTGRDVVEAAARGDEVSISALDRAGRAVGFGIVSLAHLVNLDLVVVGGGIANAGSVLFDPIMTTVSEHLLASTAPSLRVVPWSLGEKVGVLGAVASARARMAGV